MPRASRPWFRFYVEAMRDPKMRRLRPSQRWLWVAILSAARESCEPGYLFVAENIPFVCTDLADYAGMDLEEVEEGTDILENLGMLILDEGLDCWFVPKFHERQFESDTSSLRTAKHRSLERSNDVRRNGESAFVGTPNSVSVSVEKKRTVFDDFWDAYPLHAGKQAAVKAFAKAREIADVEKIIAGATRYRDDPNRDPGFTKHPATWLNQGCWDDDPLPPRGGTRPVVKKVRKCIICGNEGHHHTQCPDQGKYARE